MNVQWNNKIGSQTMALWIEHHTLMGLKVIQINQTTHVTFGLTLIESFFDRNQTITKINI